MARKQLKLEKRQIVPDAKYGSRQVSKFVNHLMLNGKKSVALRTLYGAMDRIEEKVGDDPLKVFTRALDAVKPVLEVKSRRVGGSTYQVPIEVYPKRRSSLAMRWLVSAARQRGEKTMTDRLANELLDASNGRGSAVKKKEDSHRMAEANKAFAHYRW